MITAATLVYEQPPDIVASVSVPQSPRTRFAYYIPREADAATSEDAGFDLHFSKLRRLVVEPSLWPDQADPPTEFAMTWAQLVLQQLQGDNLLPTRAVASAEGGIGICFVDGTKYADIECLNSGVILGVISNKSARPIVWEIEQDPRGLTQASQRIREFFVSSKAHADVSERPSRR